MHCKYTLRNRHFSYMNYHRDKSTSNVGERSNNVTADVIILGCSLPGIVTAHKLKKKFGKTMDIVVLDLAGQAKTVSKGNVAFSGLDTSVDSEQKSEEEEAKSVDENLARRYIADYAKEFELPLPEFIVNPEEADSVLNKVFQYGSGDKSFCVSNYHEYKYLNMLERFELTQYQNFLDYSMRNLFYSTKEPTEAERNKLLYFDRTSMEQHICSELLFSNPRDLMRATVRLVCGVSPETVSVLFYLHQCFRTNGQRNHLDGENIRLKEKLIGTCRKRLSHKLQQSVADITLNAKNITEIKTYSNERVILETLKGDPNYVCNLLAMAVRPDELNNIRFDTRLIPEREIEMAKAMVQGRAKKFTIQYEDYFWRREGYSGNILSIRGPIVWATEKPKLSATGSQEKFAALTGYLKVSDKKGSSEDAVIEQLTKLFGEEAVNPINYKESDIADVFVPRCGDYVALRNMTLLNCSKNVEWGALDIFADGDIAAALEAGHTTFIHLMRCLRPQAETFEDIRLLEFPTVLEESLAYRWVSTLNYKQSFRVIAVTVLVYVGVKVIKGYMKK